MLNSLVAAVAAAGQLGVLLLTCAPRQSAAVALPPSMHDYAQMIIGTDTNGNANLKDKKRVPVTLGVMSQCPDAEICESVFDKTLANVESIINLEMSYIGSLNDTFNPYGVECKHGPAECDGNVQQLCVAAHSDNQKDWWNFIQCQNFNNLKRIGDLSLAKQCAKVINKDWDKDFSDCYTGKEGGELLRRSVQRSYDRVITKSCSIYVNDKLICVHDGVWKDCPSGHQATDFEDVIRAEYKAINRL